MSQELMKKMKFNSLNRILENALEDGYCSMKSFVDRVIRDGGELDDVFVKKCDWCSGYDYNCSEYSPKKYDDLEDNSD